MNMAQVIRKAVSENNIDLLIDIETNHLHIDETLTPMGVRIIGATDSQITLQLQWKDKGFANVLVKPSFNGVKITVRGVDAKEREVITGYLSRPLYRDRVAVSADGKRVL